jgi:hypothetical protein
VVPPAAHNAQAAAAPPPTSPAPTSDPPAAEDVACGGCGYNLRTLAETGRCPECGLDVLPSLSAHRQWRAPLPPPDPRWATYIVDGAALSLMSFVLLVLLCAAPDGALFLPHRDAPLVKTPGRVVVLCVACAAWVTSWYSVWKWSSRAPAADPRVPRRRAAVARLAATAYFLLPFLVAFSPGYDKNPPPFPLIFLVLAAPVAAAAACSLMAGLFRRAGGGWARLEATLLAFIVPAAILLASSMTTFVVRSHLIRVSSLDLLYDLPLSPYGVPLLGRYLLLAFSRWRGDAPLIVGLAAVAVWVALLHLRLMLRYMPYATPQRERHAPPSAPSEPEP